MTEEQIQKELNSTRNIFLTGPAGTGKSYILNQYIESHENVLICAPTGIAALHIGGETMHKIFHIPIPAFESPSFAKGKKGAITQAMLKVIANADSIIIDEISMCRNDVFRFAIKVIRKAEKLKGKKIKLIVCGDFSQLPPVVKKDEIKLMKKFNLDVSGYAFTTQEWKSCNFKVIELTEIKRQDNQEFIQVLNNIRIGNYKDLSYFDKFVNENPNYDDAICICGTNAEADKINQTYLESLDGNTTVLQSYKTGRCGNSFDNDLILIKEGAKIIFTANDVINNKYKNGSFGTIKKILQDYVLVDVMGEEVEVYRKDYPIYSYSVIGNSLHKKEQGNIRQYPFKLGKAITIHKSQGQTFDKVIISPEIFAAGQLYVVLSRVRTPDGIVLLRPITSSDLIIDGTVLTFYNHNYTWKIPKTTKKTRTSNTLKKKTVKKSPQKTKSKKQTTIAKKSTKKVTKKKIK